MTEPAPTETQYVGDITTPPDEQGWQVTYGLGLQGHDMVVMSIASRSLIGVPAGGLTARRARALVKPGHAIREFVKSVIEGGATAPMSDDDVRRLREAVNEGREWHHATPTPEYLEYVAWLQGFPRITDPPRA